MSKNIVKKTKPPAPKRGDWKGVSPKRWQSKPREADEDVIGFRMISVKMRPAEAAEFEALCKQIGVTKNNALRSMARDVCGFLEVDKALQADLRTISRQLRGIGTNINQIARAGNRTGSPDYRAFMEDRQQLGPQIIALQKLLQTILNEGGRREDGLAKLTQSVEVS